MMTFMLGSITVKENILNDEKYNYLFSVDAVNELVKKGIPFREAYRKIGLQISTGNFNRPSSVKYTHEGSIGNLCNGEIQKEMKETMKKLNRKFRKEDNAVKKLIAGK